MGCCDSVARPTCALRSLARVRRPFVREIGGYSCNLYIGFASLEVGHQWLSGTVDGLHTLLLRYTGLLYRGHRVGIVSLPGLCVGGTCS